MGRGGKTPTERSKNSHRGLNRTNRRGSSRASEPNWTEAEAIVLVASTPRENQGYGAGDPAVQDVSDLLGRSPASVSMHMGNVWSILHPGSGLKNVGAVFQRVLDRYRDDPQELVREAKRIRYDLFNAGTSPRLEKELTEEEAANAERELRERFAEARLPADAIILYRYRGSVSLGVLATFQYALTHPSETATALHAAIDIMGSGLRRNPAASDAIDQRTLELAERRLVEVAPKLDYRELDEKDRIGLALRLPGLKSLKNWRRAAPRLELFETDGLEAGRARVGRGLQINPDRLCRRCVHMLLDVLDDGTNSGRL